MRYVVYRCLYGEDFIRESIESVNSVVDKIFVFWDNRPWGGVDRCLFKEEEVIFPEKFDDVLEKILELQSDKVVTIYDHVDNNMNQFTHFVNDIILPSYARPNELMFVEVDHVFRRDQLNLALQEFKEKSCLVATTRQVELWRTPLFRIPERPSRIGVVFWNMEKLDKLPSTRRQGDVKGIVHLSAFVHNLGFCFSEKVMYWKHLTAIGFSQKIGDSLPIEEWFEEKWLKWNVETNNKNLGISRGCEKDIPFAVSYDTRELPEVLRGRYAD